MYIILSLLFIASVMSLYEIMRACVRVCIIIFSAVSYGMNNFSAFSNVQRKK